MKTYKGIFFDMDGVVVDSAPLWSRIIASIKGKYGLDMTVLENNGGYELTTREAISTVLDCMGISSACLLDTIAGDIDVLYGSLLGDLAVLEPDMHRILGMLREREIPAVLVTNSSRRQACMVMDRFGLSGYFLGMLTSDDAVRGKPHPEPYFRALELAGLSGKDALAVEDSSTGAASALAAGLDCVVVSGGEGPEALPVTVVGRYGLYDFLDKSTRI